MDVSAPVGTCVAKSPSMTAMATTMATEEGPLQVAWVHGTFATINLSRCMVLRSRVGKSAAHQRYEIECIERI